MTLKLSDLPDPVLFYEGRLRNWWRFGPLAVTEGPSGRGHAFRCDCNPTTHNCVHIRKLEQHIGKYDFRHGQNEVPF